MRLSEFRSKLELSSDLHFVQLNGKKIPSHFHITELGRSTKHFLDCGGKERIDSVATMQLWTSIDFHHRLKAEKVLKIMDKTQRLFEGEDPELEIEFQQETIGRYGLKWNDGEFHLVALHTDCLAKDNCGIPVEKVKRKLSELATQCCEPNSSCC